VPHVTGRANTTHAHYSCLSTEFGSYDIIPMRFRRYRRVVHLRQVEESFC
jgi:hypothetical protein